MTDSQRNCPLCPVTSDDENIIYTHLMVSHRKSAITEELLRNQDGRRESPDLLIEGKP